MEYGIVNPQQLFEELNAPKNETASTTDAPPKRKRGRPPLPPGEKERRLAERLAKKAEERKKVEAP